MPTAAVHNLEGKQVSTMDLATAVFGIEPNTNVVRAAINRQLARRRQGTACTKTKGMLTHSDKKPWKQKHTGHARAGSKNSPLWRGGGITFGPIPHLYGGDINRKTLRLALVSCLSAYAKDNELIVLDSIDFAEPKTKQIVALLNSLKLEGKRVLFLTDTTNVNLALSARNLPSVDVINCDNINTFDLTTHDVLVATQAAVKRIEETYA